MLSFLFQHILASFTFINWLMCNDEPVSKRFILQIKGFRKVLLPAATEIFKRCGTIIVNSGLRVINSPINSSSHYFFK
ncbi:hypothetical protein CBW18_00005 [Pedobacter sp. AJM]|nr:hypothetical protein CBW18_00005 [Pedobacter sp. AJM]